jgi:hypothetical protein
MTIKIEISLISLYVGFFTSGGKKEVKQKVGMLEA